MLCSRVQDTFNTNMDDSLVSINGIEFPAIMWDCNFLNCLITLCLQLKQLGLWSFDGRRLSDWKSTLPISFIRSSITFPYVGLCYRGKFVAFCAIWCTCFCISCRSSSYHNCRYLIIIQEKPLLYHLFFLAFVCFFCALTLLLGRWAVSSDHLNMTTLVYQIKNDATSRKWAVVNEQKGLHLWIQS